MRRFRNNLNKYKMTDRKLLKEARDLIVMCSLIDKSNQCNDMANRIDEQLAIQCVRVSCPIEAIMHYDKLIKTKLDRTFEPLRDHGTHAVFCDKINDLREEAKSNYR